MQSLSFADYRQTRRFAALDGLRAITVLGLIGHHFQAGRLQSVIGIGKITVFFVLSGFVITLLLQRGEEKPGGIDLRGFYLRRQFRLLPLYYTVLAAYVVCRFSVSGEWDRLRDSLPYYLVFANEYAPDHPDITSFWHSWTLGYEQKFYLVWPLLFIVLGRFAPRWRTGTTFALAAACLGLTVLTDGTPVYYFSLLLGCGLAMLMQHERGYRIVQPLTHPVTAFAVGIAFAAIHLWLPEIGEAMGGGRRGYIVYSLAVAALVVSVLGSGAGRWLLTRPILLFVGERSYAMYLLHGLAGAAVMSAAPQWGGGVVRWLIICAVTLMFADFAQRLIELPAAAQGRRFIAWLDRRRAAPVSIPTSAPVPSRVATDLEDHAQPQPS